MGAIIGATFRIDALRGGARFRVEAVANIQTPEGFLFELRNQRNLKATFCEPPLCCFDQSIIILNYLKTNKLIVIRLLQFEKPRTTFSS